MGCALVVDFSYSHISTDHMSFEPFGQRKGPFRNGEDFKIVHLSLIYFHYQRNVLYQSGD